MAFMKADYSKNQENSYEPLPTGDYEMIITQAGERATPNGAESLQIRLTVRNDLDEALPNTNGKYHNRVVFWDNWRRKATSEYDLDQLQYVLDAAKIPEGTVLNSIDDFANAILHKPVLVHVKKAKDTYNGEVRDVNTVAPWDVHETKFATVQHEFSQTDEAAGSQQNDGGIDVTDDDLPF